MFGFWGDELGFRFQWVGENILNGLGFLERGRHGDGGAKSCELDAAAAACGFGFGIDVFVVLSKQ